ncbi:hypothetical protein MNB_SM-3-354 [hydrothermal vent metagenome]|uniref:Nitrate/nitrite sensing protein domain-containing protein n=1 Tax=hydrothermal vent metagenome TaxID=652676 RepID=A0A1W1D408_9ZZZZ
MRILLAAALLAMNVEAKSLFSNDDQKANAKYIDALRDLVIATQKTRGLTNSYLNGNKSALLLINANKREMKKAIGEMESLPLANDPNIGGHVSDVAHELVKINNSALDQPASKSFKEYTAEIEDLLMVAQTVAKQGSKDLNPLGKDTSSIMMEEILPLTEQIGRMRGMGSGIIAKKSITDVQKFKIASMISDIKDLESRLQSDMDRVLSKYPKGFNPSVKTKLSKLHKMVTHYVELTKAEVTSSKVGSHVDATTYFNKGTEIITLLMDIFDLDNKAIIEDSKGWI